MYIVSRKAVGTHWIVPLGTKALCWERLSQVGAGVWKGAHVVSSLSCEVFGKLVFAECTAVLTVQTALFANREHIAASVRHSITPWIDPLVFRFSDSKREREIFLSGLDIHCSIQGLLRPLEAKHATEALLKGSGEGAERKEERKRQLQWKAFL